MPFLRRRTKGDGLLKATAALDGAKDRLRETIDRNDKVHAVAETLKELRDKEFLPKSLDAIVAILNERHNHDTSPWPSV
jgi:hypothetical protein